MKAMFLAPSLGLEYGFYDVFTDIMRVAATQLGIDLEVADCGKSADRMIDCARVLEDPARRPDYVLLPDYMGCGRDLLPMLDAAGVGVFFVAEVIAGGARATHGEPRGKYSRWLGEIVPGDDEAGYLLAKTLTREARARARTSTDGKIHVGILSGDQSAAGLARFRGWHRLMGEEPDVERASFQYASWEREPAKGATALMLRSHPEIGVIWAANDAMALGAAAALREASRVPGKDVLLGGIDLGYEALVGVCEGTLAVSIGGHFLDGARALILLHDHHRGQDFEPWSRSSPLVVATAENAERYRRFVERRAWRAVDFTRFSRVRNPGADTPELSLESIVLEQAA
jgi:ABC-type sugar transport system substrate-binding protein